MPKEIRYTAPWKIALVLILWLLITGALVYLAITRSYDDYQFSHHAVATTGTLVQKYYTVSHGKHGPSYTYHVSYNYVVGNVQGFCGLFLLAGGAGFTTTFRANAIYQRLLREGQLCRATVTDVDSDLVGKAKTPKYYLKLQYRDMLAGTTFTGRSVYLPREEEGRWREGSTLDLRYDRAKPRWFIIDLNSGRRDTPGADGNPSSRA